MDWRRLTVVALVASACSTSPSRPTSAPPPAITTVRIEGMPATLAVGQTAQLSAVAVLSDGSSKPVTAVWQAANPGIARVSDTGLVEALTWGETTIRATYEGQTGTARVVVPAPPSDPPDRGPYSLRGVVHERAPHEDIPISDASVSIAGGWNGGRSTVTDANGRFTFSSLAATFQMGFLLRVSKSGYRDASYHVLTLPRDDRPDISLDAVPGCGYAANPAAYYSADYVRTGHFDVITSPGCSWRASLIDATPRDPSGFQFSSNTTGEGSGRVTFAAYSNYGGAPFTYTVRIEGANRSSAIYVVAVAAR